MSDGTCRIASERRGDAAIVTIVGEIDMSNVAEVEHRVLAAAEAPAPAVLIIDITHVAYLDSAALAAFARIGRRHATRLVLPASSRIHRAVTISGTQHAVPIFEHLEDALQ